MARPSSGSNDPIRECPTQPAAPTFSSRVKLVRLQKAVNQVDTLRDDGSIPPVKRLFAKWSEKLCRSPGDGRAMSARTPERLNPGRSNRDAALIRSSGQRPTNA